MGFPIVVVASGGLPVTEVASGFGTPVSIAANGYGFAVTIVASGGLPVVGSGGGAATPLAFLRVISTENRVATSTDTRSSATVTNHAFRIPVVIGQDAGNLIFSINNWFNNNSGDSNVGNALSFQDLAFESATRTVPITILGGRTVVVADGIVDGQTDPITPASMGLTKFSRGEQYWIKGKLSVPATTGRIPYGQRCQPTGAQGLWFDPAATTMSSTDTIGPYTSTGTAPAAQNVAYTPIFVLGFPYVDQQAFIGQGDSVAAGTGETVTNLLNGNGYFQRSMTDADGVSNPRPSFNFAVSGNGTPSVSGANTKWTKFLKYANIGINELGTNDVGTSNGASFDALTAAQLAIVSLMRQGGISRIVRPEFMPRVGSNNLYIDAAGQTETPGWAPGQNAPLLQTYNAAHLNDKIFEQIVSMANVRDATTPTKWLTNGVANTPTVDGTHPSSAYHALAANALRATLAALPSSTPAASILPPVLNPFDCEPGLVLSNGNLTVTTPGSNATRCVRATTGKSAGKWYWEVVQTIGTGAGPGLANLGNDLSTANNANSLTYASSGQVFFNGAIGAAQGWTTNNTLCFALDVDNLRLALRVGAGNWNANAANDPAVGFYSLALFGAGFQIFPNIQLFNTGNSCTIAFSGFAQAVPAGYSAITGGGV